MGDARNERTTNVTVMVDGGRDSIGACYLLANNTQQCTPQSTIWWKKSTQSLMNRPKLWARGHQNVVEPFENKKKDTSVRHPSTLLKQVDRSSYNPMRSNVLTMYTLHKWKLLSLDLRTCRLSEERYLPKNIDSGDLLSALWSRLTWSKSLCQDLLCTRTKKHVLPRMYRPICRNLSYSIDWSRAFLKRCSLDLQSYDTDYFLSNYFWKFGPLAYTRYISDTSSPELSRDCSCISLVVSSSLVVCTPVFSSISCLVSSEYSRSLQSLDDCWAVLSLVEV